MLKIDLDQVVRTRAPRHYRYIPRFVIRAAEKMIYQDSLNDMLVKCDGLRGAEFCRGMIKNLDLSYEVEGLENLQKSPRYILASNHPLGGLDGVILIDLISSHTPGGKVKFIVNDLLMAVEPLRDVFLPINKHGRQSRSDSEAIESTLASDVPVLIFPAGLVSRMQKGSQISDLQWQKKFINQAIAHKRDIIPVYFSGKNTNFFYKFAKLRERLGIKFNIEMLRLPAEMFKSKGHQFKITIGAPIPWQELEGGTNAKHQAQKIKEIVYSLK